MKSLKDEDALKDVTVRFGTDDQTEMANSFFLCMLSPVWRAKLCGGVGIHARQLLDLDAEDISLFSKVLALGSGATVTVSDGLEELGALGRMADLYQIEAIQGVLEEAVLKQLTVENCANILKMSCEKGLAWLERMSRELALRDFDQFSLSTGFIGLSEELLGSLLDDDGLNTEREETVLESVVRWMEQGSGGEIRGEDLLCKIRFPFMGGQYLAEKAREMIPDNSKLEALVLESCLLMSSGTAAHLWAKMKLRYLDAAVLVPRHGREVMCERFSSGSETRLAAGHSAYAVSAHGRSFICAGLHDGSIRVWSRSRLSVERTLTGHTAPVWALLSVGGRLVSGSSDCVIRVWDVTSGRCEGALLGHTHRVTCLAVSGGDRLVSGSLDGTARVWRMSGAVSAWRCERKFDRHAMGVYCVAPWEGKAASGSRDKTIRVWDVGTGAQEQTLEGHGACVRALAASGRRLISCSLDKTVRVWSMETWTCVRTVEVGAAGSPQYMASLAVSGSALVAGSSSKAWLLSEAYEVCVWDAETLELRHRLPQPPGRRACALATDGGEVLAAVGTDVVVWGR